jgi:hypothetical protein
MVGDEPIIATTIFAPVRDGRFEIECRDRSVMESLKKQLVDSRLTKPAAPD